MTSFTTRHNPHVYWSMPIKRSERYEHMIPMPRTEEDEVIIRVARESEAQEWLSRFAAKGGKCRTSRP